MPLRRIWITEDDEVLTKAIKEGVSLQRLSVRLKRSPQMVEQRAKSLGLTVKKAQRLAPEDRVLPPRPR